MRVGDIILKLRNAILILLIIIIIIPNPLTAKPFTLYGGVGYTDLSTPDELKIDYGSGFHGMIGVGVAMAPLFELMPKVEYHTFAPDVAGAFTKMRITMYGADIRLKVGAPTLPFRPFGMVGLGLATSEIDPAASAPIGVAYGKQTDFYFNFGGGVELNRFTFQIRWVSVSAEGDAINFMPITVGLKF